MYSQRLYIQAAGTFRELAALRPEMVLPTVIERFYASLDTVTEPHKLTSTLMATTSVARMIVDPGQL